MKVTTEKGQPMFWARKAPRSAHNIKRKKALKFKALRHGDDGS